jgi:hypothetical protein
MRQSRAQIAAVFFVSLLILAWNAGSAGIASPFVDPVGRIVAQDEALYASSSLEMADGGNWITPQFLGRWALYKPPVIYWLSAISIKLAGWSAFAVRLPSILAGSGTIALVFAAIFEPGFFAAAFAAAVLLLSNHLFFTLSRIGLTDALLVFEITLAMFAVWRDRRLDSAKFRWIFGLATGAAIMTKAAAGLLPLLILLLAGVPLLRFVQVSAIAAGVAAPWHLWQFYAHPRWFWAEYILGEHVAWGLAAPHQTTGESQLAFYFGRLLKLDPVLLFAGIAGLIATRSRLLFAWTGVILASVMVWQYRNVAYLLPLYPALALAAGQALKSVKMNQTNLACMACMVAAMVKVALPGQAFGLPFSPESVNPAKIALDQYANRHRGNDLILIEPDDQFYSADLRLARVRYLWVDASRKRAQLPLDFEYLGIELACNGLLRLDDLRPVFAARLREFNLDSTAAVGTAIVARNEDEVRALIAAHPEDDFYVPRQMQSAAHYIWDAGAAERVFLLSREVVQRP